MCNYVHVQSGPPGGLIPAHNVAGLCLTAQYAACYINSMYSCALQCDIECCQARIERKYGYHVISWAVSE